MTKWYIGLIFVLVFVTACTQQAPEVTVKDTPEEEIKVQETKFQDTMTIKNKEDGSVIVFKRNELAKTVDISTSIQFKAEEEMGLKPEFTIPIFCGMLQGSIFNPTEFQKFVDELNTIANESYQPAEQESNSQWRPEVSDFLAGYKIVLVNLKFNHEKSGDMATCTVTGPHEQDKVITFSPEYKKCIQKEKDYILQKLKEKGYTDEIDCIENYEKAICKNIQRYNAEVDAYNEFYEKGLNCY